MRLVKINRGLMVGGRQGGDLGSPGGREAGAPSGKGSKRAKWCCH